MTYKELFLAEIKSETVKTRKILEVVPFEKKDYKPHEKSMTLGRLAGHIAEMPISIIQAVTTETFDFIISEYVPFAPESSEEILSFFDSKMEEAISALENITEEDLVKDWTMLVNGKKLMTAPKPKVIRDMILDHTIHHRGQITVYLRMLDVPLPGIYGPTADTERVI